MTAENQSLLPDAEERNHEEPISGKKSEAALAD
jgi:hypothetical protein